MTAAVLQFNQHTKPLKQHNQSHTSKQSQSQSASNNNQSDYIDTPLTKEYHQIMIDLLNTEHPFRAVRLALSFNEANGFELIPVGMIRRWKRELKKQNSFFINQNDNSQIKSEKTKVENIEDSEIKNVEIKIQLEEGYRQLLSVKNKL
jgi:hypothetical protein